jgi:hypothetical protein
MQEEVEKKSIQLAVTTTKLSARMAAKGLAAYLRHRKAVKVRKATKAAQKPIGKQTVKELIGQNQGVSSMPIGDTGLGDFQKIAKKYGVDFAVVKDKSSQPTKYTIFFKARDADAITQVLQEYSAKQLKKQSQNRPSVLKALKKFKDIVANMPKRAKEKRKEQER